jgi:tetratricopeptide (TPR) repeat protein
VGKTAIFSQLMKEIGVDHAVIKTEGHIASMISSKDGRVFFVENTNPFAPTEISENDIVGTKPDGSRVGLTDIRAITSGNAKRGVNFRIGQQFWHVAPAESGLLASMDNNLAGNAETSREAEALKQRAVDYDPENPHQTRILIRSLSSSKGEEVANKVLAEKISAFGQDAQALAILGELSGDSGQHRQAQEILEKAVEKDPNNQAAVFNLAKQYDALGDIARASEHYKSFLHGQKIENSTWYDDAGRFFMSRGENEEAKIAFQTSLLVAQDESFREEARMKLAEIAEKDGDIMSAQGLRLRNAWNRLNNSFRRNANEQG